MYMYMYMYMYIYIYIYDAGAAGPHPFPPPRPMVPPRFGVVWLWVASGLLVAGHPCVFGLGSHGDLVCLEPGREGGGG